MRINLDCCHPAARTRQPWQEYTSITAATSLMSGPPGSDSKACPTPRLRSSSMQLIFMAHGFGSSGGIERVIVDGRGRDEDYSSPPAQIPACAANAPGLYEDAAGKGRSSQPRAPDAAIPD